MNAPAGRAWEWWAIGIAFGFLFGLICGLLIGLRHAVLDDPMHAPPSDETES